MDKDLLARYRFFRSLWPDGMPAESAFSKARAELEAERRGWTYELEEEQESYRDVYGEDPEPGTEFFSVVALDENGEPIGSLGFCSGDRNYFREVAADLFGEALATTHADGKAGKACEPTK